jgi:hypothetical protein
VTNVTRSRGSKRSQVGAWNFANKNQACRSLERNVQLDSEGGKLTVLYRKLPFNLLKPSGNFTYDQV